MEKKNSITTFELCGGDAAITFKTGLQSSMYVSTKHETKMWSKNEVQQMRIYKTEFNYLGEACFLTRWNSKSMTKLGAFYKFHLSTVLIPA